MVDGYRIPSTILYVMASILALCSAFWYKIRPKIWTGLANSTVAFANNAWSWFLMLVLLLFSLTFSPVALIWSDRSGSPIAMNTPNVAPPSVPTIATSLRLQFNASGDKPQEIETKNIEWAWDVSTFTTQKMATSKPPCPPFPSLSTTLAPCTDSIIPVFETEKEYKWVIYLVFLQPVMGRKELKVDAHGATLPKWKTYFLTDRKAYVQFDGDLARIVMDIEVVQRK